MGSSRFCRGCACALAGRRAGVRRGRGRRGADDDFLDPELAFKGNVRALDERRVEVTFEIAPGYYLTASRLKFASPAPRWAPRDAAGKVKFDENLPEGRRDPSRPAAHHAAGAAGRQAFLLAVDYQGCADKGLCYPPAQMRADVSLAGFGGSGSVRVLPGREPPDAAAPRRRPPRRRIGVGGRRAASRPRCGAAASGQVLGCSCSPASACR
jgi:thiol:disulfide interchange protein DsbD